MGMSAKALKELKLVTDRSNKHVVYIQPEMVPKWQDSYGIELMNATQAALSAGADPERVGRASSKCQRASTYPLVAKSAC